MYSRAAFDRQCADVKTAERRHGRRLTIVAVGLGVAQLLFLRWADARLGHATGTEVEGVACLLYLLLVGAMLWRMQRAVGALRPTCPQCHAVLKDMSERVASATGRCDKCGATVFINVKN